MLFLLILQASAQYPAAGSCPRSSDQKRVWDACTRQEFATPNAAEMTSGVQSAMEVCCTPEFDFDCLCCIDFTVPLQKCAVNADGSFQETGFCLTRCGVMELDAANQPAGSPLAMVDDAQTPIPVGGYKANIVTVCTKDAAVGGIAAASGGTASMLPVECIPREFTAA